MAARRRAGYGRRKRPYRRRRYSGRKRRRGNYRTGGYKGVEKKFKDLAISLPTDGLTTNWVLQDDATFDETLVGIPQGTSQSQRIGRIAFIHSIQIRGFLESAAHVHAGYLGQFVRVIIYVDKQTNKAAPLATTIMESNDIKGFRKLENVQRFSILYDGKFNLNAHTQDGTNFPAKSIPFSFYKKFYKPLQINYDGITGAMGEMTENNVNMMIVPEQITPVVTLDANVRVRYTD